MMFQSTYSQRVYMSRPSLRAVRKKSASVFEEIIFTFEPSASITCTRLDGPVAQTRCVRGSRVEMKAIRPSASGAGEVSWNGPSVRAVSPVPSAPIR